MARNYSSIYNIKDYAISSIAPKYLNMEEVNDLHIGLLGIVTELMGTISEDTFNTTTTYLNEIFPNKAMLPETIYNYAAMFQEDDIFSKPAEMMAWLFISEKDIIENSTVVITSDAFNSQKEFFLDSDMIIDIESIQFMLDYDIRITYVSPDNNTNLYTATYNKKRHGAIYKSSLDTDNSHYIKSRLITYNNENYLALYVKVHQVTRYTVTETVINNDVINAPYFKVNYSGNLSSFEVFCKEPDENEYVQLTKKMIGSSPDKNSRFCYYRMTDEEELEISFTVKDGYYKPSFGAEVIIDYTTTLGTKGEFDLYTGSDIICTGKSEVYKYNEKLIIFCITQSPSQFAKDTPTLEELSIRNVENMSTVKSYTIENDLDLYFQRFTNSDNVKMYTIKKRNDYIDRIFSTYTLYRGDDGDIIKTNTGQLVVKATKTEDGFANSFDRFYPVDGTSSMLIKPGTLFKYDPSKRQMYLTEYTVDAFDETHPLYNEPFVYSNPFIIFMTRNPSTIGYFLNTVDNTYSLDYQYINENAFVQFVCNSLRIHRNPITMPNETFKSRYDINVLLSISTTMYTEPYPDNSSWRIIKVSNGVVNGSEIRTIVAVIDDNGTVISNVPDEYKSELFVNLHFNENGSGEYIPLLLSSYDNTTKVFKLSGTIETDDFMTTTQFRVTNLVESDDDLDMSSKMVDMYMSQVSITTSVGETLTNIYTTMDNHVTFIKPLTMCKSNLTYSKASVIDETPASDRPTDEHDLQRFLGLADINIYSVPLVAASVLKNSHEEFFKLYIKQYEYVEDILDNITNNYNIDIKFYNTYGASNNFHIEGGDLIDSVNIKIYFIVKPVHGSDESTLIRDIKYFVKDYIENINDDNTNSIYISNLIKSLENEFTNIKYIKFGGIQGIQLYGLQTQAIENLTTDLSTLSVDARRHYVPEYLTIDIDDVVVTII